MLNSGLLSETKKNSLSSCLHIGAFFPCIPPLMTFWTENAVGKIPGRCQLSSKKCGNKHHFSQQSLFNDTFFLFVHWAMRRRECGWVPWIEMDRLNPVDHFHSAAQVAWSFGRVCEWQAFLVCFPPLRNPTETIPTILPCSRQCWRRIEMEARAAKRTQVCGWWDGKPNACFQATAGPAPQHLWMLCECGKSPQCLSRRHRWFSKIQKED